MNVGRVGRFVLASVFLLAATAQAKAADPPPGAPAASSEAARRQFDDAVALHKGGAYDLAVDEWEKFLKAFPDDPLAAQAQFFAGVCYLSVKDKQYDKAREAFQQVVNKFPKFEQLEKAYFNLGLSEYKLAQAGNRDMHAKAAEAFGQLIAKYPQAAEVPEALFYRGESLYAIGKKETAVAAWTDLVAHHADSPTRPSALYDLGIAQEDLGRHADASATFAQFLKDFPQHELAGEVTVRKADTLLAAGQLADAEHEFAAAAAKPGFTLADYATFREAAALAAEKKYAEAAAAYASVPQKFPKSSYIPQATLAAGNCFYLAGNQPEARKWLGKVLDAGGAEAVDSAHWIARSWLSDKNPAEALAVADKLLPASKGTARQVDLLLDKADALYDLPGRRGESAAVYARVAKDFPSDPQAAQSLYLAAFAALSAADYPAAWNHSQDFLKAFPKHKLEPDVRFVAAESQLLAGQQAVADGLYGDLLHDFPKNPDAQQWLVRRALAKYLEKQYDQVVAALKPELPKIQSPQRLAEAESLLGSSYLELKQYGEAAEALRNALAGGSPSVAADDTLLSLAAAQQGLHDGAGATGTLRRLVAEHPTSKLLDRAHLRLGDLAYASGDNGAAATEYQWVLDHAGGGSLAPAAQVGLGWAQLNKGDFAAAEKTFSTVLKEHGDHTLAPRARYGRAAARQQLKDFAGAADDAQAFLKSDPKPPQRSDALYVLGLAQEGLKQNAEAAKTFGDLLAGDPQYAAADKVLYELAWSRKGAGDDGGAIEAFTKLAHEHGDSALAAESWFNVGEAAYQKKDYKAAADAYASAVSKAPQGELAERALHKLGWADFLIHEYSAAHDAFAKQLQAYPNGSLAGDAQFMAAECLFKQEKYDLALAGFQKALAESATHKPSSAEFTALSLLHAAQSADQLKKWKDALPLLEKLAKDFPDSPHRQEAAYEQGWAEQNLDHLGAALGVYSAITQKDESVLSARARFMMGEIHFEQGQHKEAISDFFKVAYGYGDDKSPEPYHVWQASALFESARCFEVLKSTGQARKMYNELLSRYPKSEKAELARKRLTALGS